ncbi:MAG: RNA polymerase sigma-54 factor, partial [Leeuwenhoekiella sp.]
MLKQQLNFKLSQKLSPQQIQLMKLIQLPTQAFEQRIKQELEENPALDNGKEEVKDEFEEFDNSADETYESETIEADINVDDYLSDDEVPSYRLNANNYSADDEDRQIPYASGTSFTQHLQNQLNTFRLNDEEREIAEFLIGSVDDSGYLRRDISDILDDLAFTQNLYTTEDKIEKILILVQDLDPAGVGARSLEECLLIQLKRKTPTEAVSLAIDILDKAFDHFSKKHYIKLTTKFDVTEDQLK